MSFKYSLFFKVLLLLFIGLNSQVAFAQKKESFLLFEMNNEIQPDDNGMFSLIMKFQNQSNDTIKAYLKSKFPNTIKSLSQENLSIEILPNKRAFIPLKFILNKTQQAGDVSLLFEIFDKINHQKLAESKTIVKVASKRSIKIFPTQNNFLYKQEGDSVRYNVKVINGGNQTEKVLVTSSYTDFRGVVVTENKRVEIPAFNEKIVQFSKYINQDMMKMESFTTNISAFNESGNFSGNVIYTIYNANSTRRYVDPNYENYFNSDYNSNYVRVNYRDIGTTNQNINFTTHYDFSLGLNEFSYNINSSNWLEINQKTLTDTWVGYQRKGKGIRLGSISRSDLDLPINGRGIMLYQNINETDNNIVLGAIESNYNLYESFNIDDLRSNSTLFAQSKFSIKDNVLESSAIFQRNSNINNFIFTNGYKWLTPNKWTHQVKFGYGISNINHTNITEHSFSASANVSGNIGEFSFYSTNYFSSGYYPGTRRGTLFLNQRLQRGFKKFSLWSSFTLTNNNPKPFDISLVNYSRANDSRALRTDIGINFKLSNRLNVSLSPKINLEKSYFLNFNDFKYNQVDFKSSYINSSISWLSNTRNHQVMINSYTGYYKINNNPNSKPVLFGQLLWNYKQFQLNTSIQKGSMMIAEVYSAYDNLNEINRFNVSLSYRENFFNDRLNTRFAGYYNRDLNFGNTYTLSANLEYKLLDKFFVSGNMNLSQYDSKKYVNKQSYFQLGLQYNLPPKQINPSKKYGNLNVFVFYDYNANGVFDEGDKVSDNRIVKINNANFITSDNGEILYKKVPYGEYKISIPGQKWYAPDYNVYINSKTNTVAIPMQLTGVVRGKVVIETNSKLEYTVSNNLFGFTIVFINENGQKVFVKTNDRGEYSSYLPIGNYSFYILESSLPEHVYAKVYMHKIKVEQEKNIEYEPMILKVKEMKVNIKRFGS